MRDKANCMTNEERRAYRQMDLMLKTKEELVEHIMYLEKE